MKLKPHQQAWLAAHPYRSLEWLIERLADGFDVHHLDGNHDNNAADNLVLIERIDHQRLHGQEVKNPDEWVNGRYARIASVGGKSSWAKLTPAQRSARARRMVNGRYGKLPPDQTALDV